MYFIKRKILRWVFRALRKSPNDIPMVKYWRTRESVSAKVTRNRDGAIIMRMEGEQEDFPGFPRAHLLFGSLSKLKHEIKNQLFNESWAQLEAGREERDVITGFKERFKGLVPLIRLVRYDMVPPAHMPISVREIWRAWTVVENKRAGAHKQFLHAVKEILTFILCEDDGYRLRVQWMIGIFNPSAWWFKLFLRNPVEDFDLALREIEHAEIVDDMKGKIRLLRRILLLMLKDRNIATLFGELSKEMDWNKLKLTKADKYHFRGKWFKVDFDKFEY